MVVDVGELFGVKHFAVNLKFFVTIDIFLSDMFAAIVL